MSESITELQMKIAELQALVHVPGMWVCDKCQFTLTKSYLYTKSGAIGPNCSRVEPCPNDQTAMRQRTWKEVAEDNYKAAEAFISRVAILERLAGYLADGTSTEISISQDDATMTWCIEAGQYKCFGDSLRNALDYAAKNFSR